MSDTQSKSVIMKTNNNTLEEWRVKMRELGEMTKLTHLVRERTITAIIGDWEPLIVIFAEKRKKRGNCDLWV